MYFFDHIVHFVKKPIAMVEKTGELGLHTVEGGKHEMWGTYNSLCYFGLSYIEFIGVFDEELLEQSAKIPYTLHESYKKRNKRDGFTRIAIRTSTIEEDAAKLRARGYEVIGPDAFSRVRPDGSVLTWKLLHFGKKDSPFEFPFLIQWDSSDKERYHDLVKNGSIQEHPVGDVAIEEISLIVTDLKRADEWADLFQHEIVEKTAAYIKLKAPNCQFSFYLGQKNEIAEVKIRGAKEEKQVILENGKYLFVR
ncbi:VOC family protein [Ureibacillus sp. FSL K6-8385]|nr:VOC family protein [Ureibacillus terrenus]MED3660693.1 VOC family protein [Ureibacillus terrenus]MED3762813.1 VOC family protein [Ureibacillus terrenus]